MTCNATTLSDINQTCPLIISKANEHAKFQEYTSINTQLIDGNQFSSMDVYTTDRQIYNQPPEKHCTCHKQMGGINI